MIRNHQFDKVELVVADHAARVLARRAGLGTKARRVADESHRQRVQLDDFVAHDVRHRHLGGRQQVGFLVAARHQEKVLLEFRQLAGTKGRRAVDDVRCVDFGVAVLARVGLEHELRERAVQPSHFPLHQDEAAAGNLGGGGEIQPAQPLADVDVVLDRKIEFPRLSPLTPYRIVFGGFAHRHGFVGQVRDSRQQVLETILQPHQLLLGLFEQRLQLLALAHQLRDVLALGLGLADVLGDPVARGLRFLHRGLQLLARRLEALELLGVERPRPARGEAPGDLLRVPAQ